MHRLHARSEVCPTPAPQPAQTPSPAAAAAQAHVAPSANDAAPLDAAGLALSAKVIETWQSRLVARLARYKRYPPGARLNGETGVVYVRFQVDNAGHVLSVELAQSSGFAELDNEVVSLVRRASPLPAPPAGMPHTLTAQVAFSVE